MSRLSIPSSRVTSLLSQRCFSSSKPTRSLDATVYLSQYPSSTTPSQVESIFTSLGLNVRSVEPLTSSSSDGRGGALLHCTDSDDNLGTVTKALKTLVEQNKAIRGDVFVTDATSIPANSELARVDRTYCVVNLPVSFMSSETVEDLVIYKACVVPEGATLLDRSAEGFEHSAVGQILLKDDKDALKMMQKLDGKTVYGNTIRIFPLYAAKPSAEEVE